MDGKLKRTRVIFVIDESGSMGSQTADVKGGFNEYIRTLGEQPGEYIVTLIKFADTAKKVYVDRPLAEVNDLQYAPGGGTALYDAVGSAIESIKRGVSKRTKRTEVIENNRRIVTTIEEIGDNDPTIVIVMTDGEENQSRRHTNSAIKNLIQNAEQNLNTAFVYLGANHEAWTGAGLAGFSNRNTYVGLTNKTFYSKSFTDTLVGATAGLAQAGVATQDWNMAGSATSYGMSQSGARLRGAITATIGGIDVDANGKQIVKEKKTNGKGTNP